MEEIVYKVVDIYIYDPITKEFLCEDKSTKNQVNPNNPIIPACATTVKPPKAKTGNTVIWAGNKWKQYEDHRGEEWYNIETETIEIITELGDIPPKYVSTDSVRANKPDGDYWDYDSDSDQWVANVYRYKVYLSQVIPSNWEIKFTKEFELDGYYYLPSWKTLYNEIYTMLRDNIKDEYRLRDNHSQYNTVDKNSMKKIIGYMSDVVDKLYLEKQDLTDYILYEKDYDKIKKAYTEWLNK